MEEEKNEDKLGIKEWLKDNLRIIISVAIVIVIAGGIYSYSKRTQPTLPEKSATIQSLNEENEEGKVEISKEENQTAETEVIKNTEESTTQTNKPDQEKTAQVPESKETEKSFIESAKQGDGVTHLARRALTNYLEKNPDSSLTPAHKIFIEDYLRKNIGFKGRVFVGTSIEFQKDLIEKAINEAKNLNERQIKNLQRYANMVPSLS